MVEAASNDGYLLGFYRERGVRVLGIEPARNVAAVAEERGIPTIAEFFDSSLAARLVDEGTRADVFHAHNVLAHVAGLNDFVAALSTLLAEDGIAVIEVPYVKDMLDRCEFDTIYHEHLCYFSVTALDALVGRHGLALVDVGRVPIHGGSLRLRVGHEGASEPAPEVSELLAEEQRWGVADVETYRAFAAKVRRARGGARRSAPVAALERSAHCRLRGRGEGQHPPERVRHRPGDRRVRRRPEHAEAGTLHARRADPDRAAGAAPDRDAGLRPAARLEPRRRGGRPAGRLPASGEGGSSSPFPCRRCSTRDRRRPGRPAPADPRRAGNGDAHAQAHRPALHRVRRDLLLDRVPRDRQGRGTCTRR